MKTAVIYSRVSTLDQSYQSQIDDLQRYAEYANLKVIKIFAEKVSGFDLTVERSEYDKMKEFVLSNNVNLILCWELSRFGRNSLHTLNEIEFFKDAKIEIYFKKENVSTLSDDPISQLVLTVLASIAQLERQTIVSRGERGRRSAAEKGKRTCFPIMPYGFDADDKGYIVINEEEAKIVRMMYEMCSQGFSLRAIVSKLNSLHIPTRKTKLGRKRKLRSGKEVDIAWRVNTIRKILTSTLYKGIRNYKGDVIIKIPKILDEELWNKVQSIFKNHIGYINRTQYEYLFKGKIYCGKCGYIVAARTENRYAHKPSYYFCTARRDINVKCDNGQFDSKVFDDLIYTQLFKNTNLMQKVYEDNAKQFNIEDKEKQITFFKYEILKEQARTERINTLFINDHITKTDADKYYASIKSAIVELEGNIQKIEREIETYQDLDITDILIKLTDETNYNIRYEFVTKYVDKVLIYKVDNYDIDFSKLTYADFWKMGEKILTNPHGNDKLIYVELFAFSNPEPLKITLSNVSKICYINERLQYKDRHLSLL